MARSRPNFSPDEQALLADLKAAGFALTSIWNWVNRPAYFPDAVPVLLRHLERTRDEHLAEGIARALADRRYRDAGPGLVRKFAEVEQDATRWAIANAIVTVGFRGAEDQILAYVRERRYGTSRELLVGSLNRIRRPEVEPLLIELLENPVLDCFAARALSYCGGPAALQALTAMDLSSRTLRTRKGVPKAIERIRKRLAAS